MERTERTYLHRLAGEVLGLPTSEVPTQLVFSCRHTEVARAITLRNAVHVVERFVRGETVRRTDEPWHLQYAGRHDVLIAELKRTGYLNSTVN